MAKSSSTEVTSATGSTARPIFKARVSTWGEGSAPPVSSTTAASEHRGMAARPSTSRHSRGERLTGCSGRRFFSTSHTPVSAAARSKRENTSLVKPPQSTSAA